MAYGSLDSACLGSVVFNIYMSETNISKICESRSVENFVSTFRNSLGLEQIRYFAFEKV